MWPLRKSEPSVKNRSKLFLEPEELVRKLLKEMENDKVTRGSHISVRNRYTVYLCRDDYKRLSTEGERLVDKLELELARHARAKKYELPGAIGVNLVADSDLEPGYFGIFAERELPSSITRTGRGPSAPARATAAGAVAARPKAGPSGASGLTPARPAVAGLGASSAAATAASTVAAASGSFPISAASAAASTAAANGTAPVALAPTRPAPTGAAPAGPVTAASASIGAAPAGPAIAPPRPSTVGRSEKAGGSTEIISPTEAAELGLATQTIVLKAHNQEYAFNKGRVIVGRSRDVDFRIDNADVSRRHAAFYWSDGNIMIKDLESTNGTMVNGYPVDSTVVHPGDVVLIGDCIITVESR
jgi:FHA domain/FhaA, N-terminal domain